MEAHTKRTLDDYCPCDVLNRQVAVRGMARDYPGDEAKRALLDRSEWAMAEGLTIVFTLSAEVKAPMSSSRLLISERKEPP